MSRITITLETGYKVGDVYLKDAVLRSVTTGDIIEAGEESEKLIYNKEDEPELVVSPTRMATIVLAKQIVSIGNMQGPLTVDELKNLDPVDFNLLQDKAAELEKSDAKKIIKAGETRGRSEPTSPSTWPIDVTPCQRNWVVGVGNT